MKWSTYFRGLFNVEIALSFFKIHEFFFYPSSGRVQCLLLLVPDCAADIQYIGIFVRSTRSSMIVSVGYCLLLLVWGHFLSLSFLIFCHLDWLWIDMVLMYLLAGLQWPSSEGALFFFFFIIIVLNFFGDNMLKSICSHLSPV